MNFKQKTVQEKYIDETKQGEAYAIADKAGNTKKLFLESYGCQMNFSDSEIVASILQDQGYNTTVNLEEADLLITTFGDEKEEAFFGLDTVVICPEPTSKDYLHIEQKINQFIYNRYQ